MSTAACGINCDVCRLNLLGICSTCGSGRSQEGLRKMAAQERILGQPCPVLACAVENRVEYCPRDCNRFPCTLFRAGPYPFSHGYLDMQERRRSEKQTGRTPSGNAVEVPTEYWDDLERRDIEEICENALAAEHPAGLILPFLTEHLLLDRQNRCLYRQEQEKWNPVENPLLELLCLVHVLDAGSEPLSHEMVSVKELKTAHFFQGPHELKVRPLLERYGNDLDGFRGAAERLGGEPLDLADAAYRLLAFPKVPLYYLFWKGDQEFHPTLSILFDRSVEHHLAADAIWGLVTVVSDILLLGDAKALL